METQKINQPIVHTLVTVITHKHTCKQQLLVITSIRVLLLLLSAFLFSELPAQKIWEQRKGCVRMQGNLAPGILFSQKSASAYVNGDMDLFIDNHIAVTGSAWYSFALNKKSETGIKANHAIFGGLNYHFLKPSRFDPYIGFTPGVGIVQVAYKEGDEVKRTPYTPVPLVSASMGFNYYVGWIFHIFVKAQFVTGAAFTNMAAPVRLDEMKIMAGLGWNLRLWKPKKSDSYKPVLIDRNK